MEWLDHLREGPGNAERMTEIFPWALDMIGCPHDPVYHAEGDPWTHTCMVAEKLESSPGFVDLSPERREILRLSAWFHDVAKPATTRIEWDPEQNRDRVRQPGHAALGAKMAWAALIDAGYDPMMAREVHAMVFWHQRPTHLPGQNNMLKRLIEYGHSVETTNWEDLIRLCHADQDGRICLSNDGADQNLDLLMLHLEEESENAGIALESEPWPFASAAARLKYLSSDNGTASPYFTPQEPAGSRMVLMSGLPGSGKDTAIARHYGHLPVVSLDRIRDQLRVDPSDPQGRVLQAGIEEARTHLRSGQDFVWNSTGLNPLTRGKIIRIALGYDARIEAVSLDVPLGMVRKRNRERDAAVPEAILDKLERKREPVTVSEAHELWSIGPDGEKRMVFGADPVSGSPCPSIS